mgnify:CR=1 FL=1
MKAQKFKYLKMEIGHFKEKRLKDKLSVFLLLTTNFNLYELTYFRLIYSVYYIIHNFFNIVNFYLLYFTIKIFNIQLKFFEKEREVCWIN